MPKPRYKPTDRARSMVKTLAGYGIKQTEIAAHPDVACGMTTLHKYYRDELDAGDAAAQGLIGEALFDEAVNKRNIPSLIFLGKTRLGLKEVQQVQQTGADGGPIQVEQIDVQRLIADKLIGLKDSLRVVGGTDTEQSQKPGRK